MPEKLVVELIDRLNRVQQEVSDLKILLDRQVESRTVGKDSGSQVRRHGWGHLPEAERSAIGQRAARTRRLRAAGRKAAETRRRNAAARAH